ncbi:hypothetical protein MTP99_001993 [Tenebrio molitor]|nr:hypothetical protein MTP99_001993 [Tenebrio molitor]
MFSSEEYTEMPITYGESGRNANAAERLYRERFPNRLHPSSNVILRLINRVRNSGSVVPNRKGVGGIDRTDNEYSFQVQVGETDVRGKRQTDQRAQFIDSLFNIPISTLNAVNNLVQNTRPAIQNLRAYAARRLERNNKAAQKINQTRPQRPSPVYVPLTEETVGKQ